MLGLGMLGNDKKPATIIVGSGMKGGKPYNESYGEGKESDELDMFNPVEMMMGEFIKSVHAKETKKATDIFCSMMKIERMKGGVEVEINN